jgi:L-threonylcarbamoyladenylate synthase
MEIRKIKLNKLNKNKKINKKNKIFKEEIDLIVDYFRKGKVVVYPTDTIYGLGCLATNKKAIKRIYKIKKREKGKALLILVSSLAMVKKYCYVSKEQEKFLRMAWKISPSPRLSREAGQAPFYKGSRPVTVILKSRGVLPKELTGWADSLAVRLPRPFIFGRGLPKNEFLIKIIKAVGAPIVSTSANISGKKSLVNVANIDRYFMEKSPQPLASLSLWRSEPLLKGKKYLPDLVIDAGKLKNKPSRIIDITDVKNIKVIRK